MHFIKDIIDSRFIMEEEFTPVYLKTYQSGRLKEKVERALEFLRQCRCCGRRCEVNRLDNQKTGTCRTGRKAKVSSFFAHMGEEDCLRGWNGSGTIFFGNCNLKCIFCQNYDLSWGGEGQEVEPEDIARMMLYLQKIGCHNINFVTPTHVVPQILEALLVAVEEGLKLPLVYNCGGYESPEVIELLDGVFDIYMPDFKFWQPEAAKMLANAEDYPEIARQVIKMMHQQTGPLVFDRHGIALRGVLVRHLVLPGGYAGTRDVARYLATEVSKDTYINVMDQYYPSGRVMSQRQRCPEMSRRITQKEYEDAINAVLSEGLYRIDVRFPRSPNIIFV